MDSQPTLFIHTFSSSSVRPIWEIVGAMKPVHISIWVDMVEGADGTITCQNTLRTPTTLCKEDHKKSSKFNNAVHAQNIWEFNVLI